MDCRRPRWHALVSSDTWPRASGEGGLTSYRDGQWHAWHTKDGLPSDYVVNYFQDSKGRQFVVTLACVAQLDVQKWTPLLAGLVPRHVNWGSGSEPETPQTGLVISTGTEVFVRKSGKWSVFAPSQARTRHHSNARRAYRCLRPYGAEQKSVHGVDRPHLEAGLRGISYHARLHRGGSGGPGRIDLRNWIRLFTEMAAPGIGMGRVPRRAASATGGLGRPDLADG